MGRENGLSLGVINRITTIVNSADDLHSLLTVIMDTARELLGTEGASLLLYDEAKQQLIFDIARGPRGELLSAKRVALGDGIAGRCAKSLAPIVVDDASRDERIMRSFDQEIGFVTRNLIAVPMIARGALIGVLEVVNFKEGRAIARTDVRLLEYLSNMAALAVQNRRLYDDLKQRAEELDCIYRISRAIQVSASLEQISGESMRSISEVLGIRKLCLVLLAQGKRPVEFSLGFEASEVEFFSGRLLSRMDTPEDSLVVSDVDANPLFEGFPASADYVAKSFLCVRILGGGQRIGVLVAADKLDALAFNKFEVKVISTVAAQLGEAVVRLQAKEREFEIARYRRDMDMAAQIQLNSLPDIPKRLAGLEVATRYEACRDVGGDFFDMIYHSEHRQSFIVADVAGKGVAAALFMEYSKTVLSSQVARNLDPVTTLKRVTKELFQKSKTAIFVTAMLVQVEQEYGRLRIACAGHNRQLLYRSRSATFELLSAKGLPLGVLPDGQYVERLVPYEAGDLIVLYTDGITEAETTSGEQYGEERLIATVKEHAGLPVSALADEIMASVRSFAAGWQRTDDATLMVVRL